MIRIGLNVPALGVYVSWSDVSFRAQIRGVRISRTGFAGLRISAGLVRVGIGSDFGKLRSYFVLGYGHDSVQLQWQRTGFMLLHHTDGPEHNHAASIVLRKPKRGELKVLGPHRRWLNGRVQAFDGGQSYHYVTQIEGGPRVVLILQRASDDAVHPR